MKDKALESEYRNKATSIFGLYLKRGRDTRESIVEQLQEAHEQGNVSSEEMEQVFASDLLWMGRLLSTKREVFLVMEASWFVEMHDVERASTRAAILRRVGIKAILEGRLAPKDLPEAWNAKFQETLGITPPNNREGVLQDVHWSWGLIGHFQSYALGNIIALQWCSLMAKDIPNQDELMAAGNITPIREWLGEHVHQYARKYTPKDLIQRITGGPINTGPYLDYLTGKYGGIYGV